MAKINQYPAKTVPSNNDEFVLHDPSSGSTKKMTRGDLIGGAPLPANSVNEQAIASSAVASGKIADDAVTPAKRSGGFKVGVMPGSVFSGTGTRTFTVAFGFKPKLIRFTLLPSYSTVNSNVSIGVVDEDLNQWSATIASGGGASGRDSNPGGAIRAMNTPTTVYVAAAVTAITSTSITFNVTTANTGYDFGYEAYA